jgi:hypothetical protein
MSTADRLRQQHISPRRPRARKASSTTDDIPLLAVPSPIHILPRLARHATDPACASLCTPPRSIVSTSARSAAYVTMTESVTITFSQTGVQPPVYVVTSLSEPPWEPLEMAVDHEQTASANLIFTRQFKNAAEGDHQYKIRVGDGHWVVDDSKDSGTYACVAYQSTTPLTHHSRR